MKKLLTIFSLMFALSVVGADYKSFTFTITNAPTDGETIVIGGSTRTWKDTVAIASTQIAIHPELGGNATNLFNHFALYPVSGVIVTKTDTNAVKFQGLSLTATQTGTWADIDETTQTLGASWSIAVPFSNQAATNRNRLANMLVADLNEFANTNQLNQNSNITAQLVGMTNTQTIAGKKFMTNELNEFAGTFRGPLYSNEGSLTNFNLYSAQIFSGEFSGSIGSVTNGFLTNIVVSGLTMTNGVNHGNAFSSPSSNEGEQFGLNAIASGFESLAVGPNSISTGVHSASFGFDSRSTADESAAIGPESSATALRATALGATAVASNINSTAIGYSAHTFTSNQIVLGSSAVNHIYTPGRIEALQGITNAHLMNSNTISGSLAFTRGDITTLATGANAGIDPSTNVYITVSGPSAAFTINGIAGGRNGRFLILQNSSSYPMTIMHESGVEPNSTNRILTPSEADVVVSGNPGFAMLIYDSSVSRWIMINDPGESGVAPETTNFTISTNIPAFDTWVTNGSTRASLFLELYATAGTDVSTMHVIVESEGNVTNSWRVHNGYVGGSNLYHVSDVLDPGARWKVTNDADPNELNEIRRVKVASW